MAQLLTTTEPPRSIVDRLGAVRHTTDELATPLSAEDQTVQSMPDVSPTKWHRAHTTWFFETFLLSPHLRRYTPFDPAFGFLFNSYYEAVGPRHPRPERGLLSRPGVERIAAYRMQVDAAMGDLLSGTLEPDVADLTDLGIHHEQQHQELLLMDIKHVLSCNPLQPAYDDAVAIAVQGDAAPLRWVAHSGGLVETGHAGPGFAFDNESPRHTSYLAPFEIASRAAACGDWLAFIDDGGYLRPDLWLSDGWAAVQANGWRAPLYWSDDDGIRTVFTLGGRREICPAEPVCHVSYYEADAFARWSGARLPVEAEWEVASVTAPQEDTRTLDRDVLHPRAAVATNVPARPQQMYGDVWEWTASAYAPYPGFRAAPGAVGEYNGKFMVNQYVLRGGCCVTPPRHVRATYRNFFHARARWAFSGVRLARDL